MCLMIIMNPVLDPGHLFVPQISLHIRNQCACGPGKIKTTGICKNSLQGTLSARRKEENRPSEMVDDVSGVHMTLCGNTYDR